jgi:hypothetical protein
LTGAFLFRLGPEHAKHMVAAHALCARKREDREQGKRSRPRSGVGIGFEILDPQTAESSEPQGFGSG